MDNSSQKPLEERIINAKTWVAEHRVLAAVVVAIIFSFYWYQIRPSTIIKKCDNEAVDDAVAFYEKKNPKEAGEGTYLINNYNTYYKRCLRAHGIED